MSWWDYKSWDEDDDDEDLFLSSRSFGRRYKSSLGWSSRKLTDTTSYYSKYWGGASSITSETGVEKDKLILLTKAYKAVRDMVVILDFPFDVEVELSNYGSRSMYKAGSRKIQVPSDVIDRSSYSDEAKINIMCGLGTHEAAHLKYTERRVYRQYADLVSYAETYFTNLIEDRRVEDKLLSERPGYLDFIEESNKYRYNKLKEAYHKDVKSHFPGKENMIEFILNAIKFVRFPNELDAECLKKYKTYFTKLKDILSEECQFTKDSCILGSKLYNEIKSIQKAAKMPDNLVDDFIAYLAPQREEFVVKYGLDEDTGMYLSDKDVTTQLRSTASSALFSDLITGIVEFGEGKDVFIEKPVGNKEIYMSQKQYIKKYIPGIKKLIRGTDRNYEFSIHGCREGMLDTNKLAEAYQGVPQVYIKKGKVSTNKTTVCVLIDQSGSMAWSMKDTIAKQAAILLNESLKDSPGIDLYIYGHTADIKMAGDTLLYVYKEGSKYSSEYALSTANAKRENRDGLAILEAAKRVRKNTQEHCIMFVISDGEPCASGYHGMGAVEDVHKKVKEVEGMDFTVIQVCIDSVGCARDMFDNVISLNYDLANFPKRLSQVIKKSIVKSKQTTVS